MRAASLALTVLIGTTAFAADENNINFDAGYNFAGAKTFQLRPATIGIAKPEINNRLFVQRMDDAVRMVLAGKGLKEAADRPDLIVRYVIAGKDYSVAGPKRLAAGAPGSNAPPMVISSGPQMLTEGTLVIDMLSASDNALVWQGTYRDEEPSGPKLSRKLPEDATRLLMKYPPPKK